MLSTLCYKRKVICPPRVGQVGVNVDLSQGDKRLQELLNYDQATSDSKQRDKMGKRRFTVTAVSLLGNKVDILVAALSNCHAKMSILT